MERNELTRAIIEERDRLKRKLAVAEEGLAHIANPPNLFAKRLSVSNANRTLAKIKETK